MREFNALSAYPAPTAPRRPQDRTMMNRITASYRGEAFFDGGRADGYGGLVDDGRWKAVAESMVAAYGLKAGDLVLQLGAEKGFLLREFAVLGMKPRGTETSAYAIEQALDAELALADTPPTRLPWLGHSMSLVLALGPVYTLTLADAIRCLREIERVKKMDGASFVTLAAYESEADFWLLRQWSLLGTLILRPVEWLQVLEHAGYTGDYHFVTARTLNLQ